jgi:hypothetical protein
MPELYSFKKTKFNSIFQVIFRGAYWLRFWAQLQHKAQAKDTLIAMSRKLEVVTLQIANRGWNIFSFTLVGGLLPVCCFFTLFVDISFELCNFLLCTSSDVVGVLDRQTYQGGACHTRFYKEN